MNVGSGSAPVTLVLLVALAADARADAGGPAGGASATTRAISPLPLMLGRLDELHRRRDDPAAWSETGRLVQAALAQAPNDFATLWRAARYYFWASDDPARSNEERSRLGKQGWDLAERAISANPGDAAGYYWSAVCMGNYALGLGVVRALSQGLEGKFRDRLGRATALNDGYQDGGVETAWGRFYDKLPWPKRDRKKAEEHLRRALAINPAALRARVYLANVYLESDRAPDAKRLLDEVRAAPVGRYDAPEERRAKAMAEKLRPDVDAKLR